MLNLAGIILYDKIFTRKGNSSIKHIASTIVGQVAEWLMAADCKSAARALRRFESSPVHQHLFYEYV